MAAMEAAKAVWNLIGEDQIENFVVVGGAALLFHGSELMTVDADLAITGDSLEKFIKSVHRDARFTKTVMEGWEFQSSYGFMVEVDFLDKSGAGGFLHEFTQYSVVDGVPVATLVDLALGKRGSWMDQGRPKDLDALEWILVKMAEQRVDFSRVGMEICILQDIVTALPQTAQGRRISLGIRNLL